MCHGLKLKNGRVGMVIPLPNEDALQLQYRRFHSTGYHLLHILPQGLLLNFDDRFVLLWPGQTQVNWGHAAASSSSQTSQMHDVVPH